MKFAVKYLSQFVNKLPENISVLSEQLVNLGIEIESVTTDAFGGNILEVAVAPNRADLLSIVGIARELAFINNTKVKLPDIENNVTLPSQYTSLRGTYCLNRSQTGELRTTAKEYTGIDSIAAPEIHADILEPKACPKYSIRVITDINSDATTPDWMQEVLNNAGIGLISPVVDITNYVMLELGQPLHAFDLNKISDDGSRELNKQIVVRYALNTEELVLLNNNKVNLTTQDLIIADLKKPLAIAGIMGGIDSAITKDTKNIVIECAYFEPIGIRMTSLRHNILTDSAQRFIRNIDPNLQDLAMQRVSDLLKEIVGGKFGHITTIVNEQHLPSIVTINLNKDKIKQVLGIYPPEQKVIDILQGLGMTTIKTYSGWKVTVPSWRQDIKIQEDLIEELARLIGYNNILPQTINLPVNFKMPSAGASNILNFSKELQYKNCLANRGYTEAINYSFIDSDFAKKFYPDHKFYELKNPISKNMNIMRPGLWPGLVMALMHNQNRQQTRVRLFELGTTFVLNTKTDIITEHKKIAGIISGNLLEENWQKTSNSNKNVDFFTLKSDVMALMQLENNKDIHFIATNQTGLHPLQTASIYIDNVMVGLMGALHPELLEQLSIIETVFVFELDLALIVNSQLPKFIGISKFPSIRRDFSVIVDIFTTCDQLEQAIQNSCGELLKKIVFFDLYSGDKLPCNKKSIAFGVILQHPERTLVEQEINDLMAKILINLEQIGAHLRT